MPELPQDVLITGCGAVSPLGVGVPALWQGLLAGRSGVGPIRSFDTAKFAHAHAAEVAGFDAAAHFSAGEGARLARVTQYALVAAREALADAGIDLARVDRTGVGIIMATTLGAMSVGEAYQRARHDSAPFAARQLLRHPYYSLATTLAREFGVFGPVVSPSIACASGTLAVGLALDLIRRGQAEVLIVGGAEALCEFVVSGFNCLRATAAEIARPFDARRNGLILGEGAAVLVIESRAHAAARGVSGEVVMAGTGLSSDAMHMTAPARDGAGAARAMRAAMADARVDPTAIDFISAHGTGTVYNDAMEVAALTTVFGEGAGRIPVNGIKGSIGHTLGAAGSFEAIMCARILREGLIPPTANCEQLDPACTLDVVCGVPRRQLVRTALSTSSAFAGNNAAIVLCRA